MNNISEQIKISNHGDEYFSPQNVVDMIVPYIKNRGYKTIWCPFDHEDSNFVTTFQDLGFNVNYGHLETGQDFFEYDEPQGDVLVTNPPYSKRNAIMKRLFEFKMPFAIVMNFNGLFDSKERVKMFRKNRFELLIPSGRMKFIHKEKGKMNSPNFQSIYLCSGILDNQIEFSDAEF